MTPPAVSSTATSDLGGAESSATLAPPTKYRPWINAVSGVQGKWKSACGGWAQGTLVPGSLYHDWWPTVDPHRPSVFQQGHPLPFPRLICSQATRPTIYIQCPSSPTTETTIKLYKKINNPHKNQNNNGVRAYVMVYGPMRWHFQLHTHFWLLNGITKCPVWSKNCESWRVSVYMSLNLEFKCESYERSK